jgi:leucyl aminopeptidase
MKVTFTQKPMSDIPTVSFYDEKDAKILPELKRLGDKFNITHSFESDYVQIYVSKKGLKTGDDWREKGFKLVQYINDNMFDKVYIRVPYSCSEFIEGMLLGNYSFQKYKSEPKENSLKEVILYCDDNITEVIERATDKVTAQFLTRDMVNGTPEDMNSTSILSIVEETFNKTDVDVKFYGPASLEEFGMHGHLAVNRASRHPAMTIKLEYTPKKASRHVVLVGKGLTYDSGGLSIKPGNFMVNMKSDKGGAMTVFGIMKGIADVGCPVKVTAYLAIAENMIDGSAYKPDDVIRMMNGKTVHIKNTDAEGRVVLFDNLCLAEQENPHLDEIYTFATLTGAAVSQFGEEGCGMVGFNDKMKRKIKKVGEAEGEIFCDAEFHKFMMNGVDDTLADLSNTGTPNQGCQKAGLFLTNALSEKMKKKYLHLDIAAPAFSKTGFGTNQAGGTGFGVRTFIEYLGG